MLSETSSQPSQNQQSSDPRVEIITPLEVHPYIGQPDLSHFWRSRMIVGLLLIIALAAMVTGGFFFIDHLNPSSVKPYENVRPALPPKTHTHSKSTLDTHATVNPQTDIMTKSAPELQKRLTAPGTQETMESAQLILEKEAAEKELGKYLKLKQELDKRGVAEWGGQTYKEMINLSREADSLFMDNAFLDASKKYVRAGKKAEKLADESGAVFQQLVKEGLKALEDGHRSIAQGKLHAASMIEPSDAQVRQYLKRTEKIDEVNRLFASGQNHEKNNRLAFAYADYQEALKLDPQSRKAQKALTRVKEQISNEQFQKHISDGLTAYHNGDYRLAKTQLLKAKSFQPDSREVREALAQVDAAIRMDKIERLRREATAVEAAEDWRQALKLYLAVLQIDPNISFAVQGQNRALEQIRIAKRMEFFLQKPDVMASERQLQNAVLTIEAAEKIKPKGPHLNARLDKLKTLVDAARTLVPVRIESDNFTEVTVYKIGKLGHFIFHELSLRPGVYTVVGSRNGYRDVRKKIIVKSGQELLHVTVKCQNTVKP